jgi:imidazolonepropionase-like amidohydrolase
MGEAGLTFRDILASLTTAPARRRGLEASAGRVAPGYDADLVVLAADPARRVTAFAEVAYTIRGGTIIYRQPGRQ